MKKNLLLLISSFLFLIIEVSAQTASFPHKPVKLIVPWPPGGVADFVGRTLGEKLSSKWGQPVVVENRAGAGTNIGSEFVAKSQPDGYTLLIGSSNNVVNMYLFKKNPYDIVKDFEPVTLIVQVPNILVVNPSVNANTAKELILQAKNNPGKLNYASAGNGSPAHLAAELFKKMAGIDILAITYKGAGPAVIDLLGGQVDMMFTNIPATLQNIKAEKLKALGVTSLKKNQAVPLVPAIADSGLPGYEFSAWYGVLAPAGTPKELVAKINADIVGILKNPEISAKLISQGTDVVAGDPENFRSTIKSDLAKYSKLISEIGLVPE
jgi:tripartite-type tricarboxylate transporter receptor subunit TctC